MKKRTAFKRLLRDGGEVRESVSEASEKAPRIAEADGGGESEGEEEPKEDLNQYK